MLFGYIMLFDSYVSEYKLSKEQFPTVIIDYAREGKSPW